MPHTGDCYFITAPTFETKSERDGWLNGVQAAGKMLEIKRGDRLKYDIFSLSSGSPEIPATVTTQFARTLNDVTAAKESRIKHSSPQGASPAATFKMLPKTACAGRLVAAAFSLKHA